MPVKTKIKLRRDTAANWASTNPVLASGEMGYATDTKALKTGDGVTAWNSLPITAQAGTNATVSYIDDQGAYLTGNGLRINGNVYNYASTPDSAVLSITGDIDIIAKATLVDWTPTTSQALVGKTGASSSYLLYININDGRVVLRTSADGSTNLFHTSTASPVVADGGTKWIRATLDVNDGAGNRVVKFYTSDDGSAWTQLGTTLTVAGTTSMIDTTAALELGSAGAGAQTNLNGTIHRVIIRNGFDGAGVIVFDANPETAPANAIAFAASSETGIKSGGLTLREISNQYASTPDINALDITGDIDIRIKSSMVDWTPTQAKYFTGKWGAVGQLSYYCMLNTNGTLGFVWSNDGTNTISANSSIAPTVSDGASLWIRYVLDVDNGSGGRDVLFYTSSDGITWTQLGTTITGSGTTSIFASTASLFFGTVNASTTTMNGTLQRVQICNGINGTVVFDKDFSEEPSGTTTMYGFSTTGIGENGLVMNGTSAYYASVQHSSNLAISGEIDLIARISLFSYTGMMISKSPGSISSLGLNYAFYWNSTSLRCQFSDGTVNVGAQVTGSTAVPLNTPTWVRATVSAPSGGNRTIKFYYAADQESVPTSWTQIGTDQVITCGNFATNTGSAYVGSIDGAGSAFNGIIYRAIVKNGIDGTVSMDTNFSSQKIGTISFNESSTNSALVSLVGFIRPVITVNGNTDSIVSIITTKYGFGIPNFHPTSNGTATATESTSTYGSVFYVTTPISVDMCAFEVTTGPTVEATMRIALYAAGSDLQPTGLAAIDFGYVTVNTGATGVFSKQVSPAVLQPGAYFILYKISSGMALRYWRGGWNFAHSALGSNPFISQYFFSSPYTLTENTPLPVSPKWTSTNKTANPVLNPIFLRWSIV